MSILKDRGIARSVLILICESRALETISRAHGVSSPLPSFGYSSLVVILSNKYGIIDIIEIKETRHKINFHLASKLVRYHFNVFAL